MEEDIRLTALADSLKIPFDHEAKKLKKEIADTFVPTVNRAKELYRDIEKQVDIPFGQGLLAFNQASRDMEMNAIKERDELQTAHALAQVRSSICASKCSLTHFCTRKTFKH